MEIWIEQASKEIAQTTLYIYKAKFRAIMKAVYGSERYPKCVSWIKLESPKKVLINNNMRDKILTEEEIKKLVDFADSLKYKALIMVTWEGALRASEVLSLRIRDVEFTKNRAKIRIVGKTGERTLFLFKSDPYLREWINLHPERHNPNAYVFFSRYSGEVKQMSAHAFATHLKRIAEKAGIKKKVHPHILRHTRLTELAKILTEQELKLYAGWEKDSRMASVYVHLSGRDTEKICLKASGIKIKEEEKKSSKLEPKICPKCGWKNTPEALYCNICGWVLDEKIASIVKETIKEKTEKLEKLERALRKLAKEKPDLIKELLEAMES